MMVRVLNLYALEDRSGVELGISADESKWSKRTASSIGRQDSRKLDAVVAPQAMTFREVHAFIAHFDA